MHTNRTSHIPFVELPSEARALLSIYAVAALVQFGAERPKQSDLIPALEIIWNWNRLCLEDLSDPFRMTDLLIEHFAPVPASVNEKGAQ
jgi:hypothetical protein